MKYVIAYKGGYCGPNGSYKSIRQGKNYDNHHLYTSKNGLIFCTIDINIAFEYLFWMVDEGNRSCWIKEIANENDL